MRVVVVVPTYDERDNIEPLIDSLLRFRGFHVLVVDDRSPDGTGAVIRRVMQRSRRVSLLEGDKQGLGVAYFRGFRYALEHLNPDVVVEMDADGSHDPADVPRLVKALERADLVVGSRYVLGGGTPDWSFRRKLMSRAANFYAREVGGLWEVNDCTAGFRAYKASLLQQILPRAVAVKGYSVQVSLLSAAITSGARVVEVPVTFRDRSRGESKLKLSDALELLVLGGRLALDAHKTLIPFLVVGFSGLLVNLGLFILLLRGLDVALWLSWAVALEVSVVWNFFWHERWTFRGRGSRPLFERAVRYHLASFTGIIINALVFFFLVSQGLLFELANVVAVGAATFTNYLLSALYSWRK